MPLIRYAESRSLGDKAPEPNLDYSRIPKERYRMKEYMKLEVEYIWTKI